MIIKAPQPPKGASVQTGGLTCFYLFTLLARMAAPFGGRGASHSYCAQRKKNEAREQDNGSDNVARDLADGLLVEF